MYLWNNHKTLGWFQHYPYVLIRYSRPWVMVTDEPRPNHGGGMWMLATCVTVSASSPLVGFWLI